MHSLMDKAVAHPVVSLGAAMLWGLLEFFALRRVRRSARRRVQGP